MKNELLKQADCLCPLCGCHDLEYDAMEFIDSNSMIQKVRCQCCGMVYDVYYETRYCGCTINQAGFDENGELLS